MIGMKSGILVWRMGLGRLQGSSKRKEGVEVWEHTLTSGSSERMGKKDQVARPIRSSVYEAGQ